MYHHSLPLGRFHVHLISPSITSTLGSLKSALQAHDALLEKVDLGTRQGELEFERSAQSMDQASTALREAFQSLESPVALPRNTINLILASIIAEGLSLSFEVVDYQMESDSGDSVFWLVQGRVTNPRGRTHMNIGTSFVFNRENEKMVEGALLSACSDAFVRSVFASLPFPPRDTETIEKLPP